MRINNKESGIIGTRFYFFINLKYGLSSTASEGRNSECPTANLMADSYGFASIEELSRVQKYLHEHGRWQLEQVSVMSKQLVACYYS